MTKLKGAAKAAFLARINKGRVQAGLKKIKSKTKSVIKRHRPKTKTSKRKTNKTSKKNPSHNKSVAGNKKGKSGMSRIKKFLLGLGVGAGVSLAAGLARQPAIESSGPIIDAAVGGGVEAQIGTAIPRLIRTFILRNGANGGNGGGVGGA